MSVSDRSLSIADFRRLGAFEIYSEAEVVAFAQGKKTVAKKGAKTRVLDEMTFRLGDLFASPTKFRRLLWLARRPGVLPESVMRQFAHRVAQESLDRLIDEGVLSDIRLTAGMAAHEAHLKGERHLRSLEPLRESVAQAAADHLEHAGKRAADGCRAVEATLDPDAYEAGAQAAYVFLDLFTDSDSEHWLRTSLRELVEQAV